jgi:DNA-binding response OmpR family regulator
MQVLVVEDEALIRMLVCDLLEAAGYMCIEAVNATEALALLDSGLCRPEIMVTDFNLGPGLDGQALAKEASFRRPGLVVTFVTGNPEAFDDYRLQPWERLVAKPFSGPELVEAVSGLQPPHEPGELAAALTRSGLIADHSAESRAELV